MILSRLREPTCLWACEAIRPRWQAHRRYVTPIPTLCLSRASLILGVLTKPDRIPTGEETRWLSFIKNITEPLDNNWFCVKQPSSQDLKQGLSYKQARTREDEFFSSTPPWTDLEAVYQRYLRTPNLVERLSNILSDLISKR